MKMLKKNAKITQWSDGSSSEGEIKISPSKSKQIQQVISISSDEDKKNINLESQEKGTVEEKTAQSLQAQQQSIAERTKKLYTQQSSNLQYSAQRDIAPVIKNALEDDLESHRVMYQYLFKENKKKIVLPNSGMQGIQGSQLIDKYLLNENSEKLYLSALNTRRNPDLLVPGGKFLKGNMYFKNDSLEAQEELKEVEDGENEKQEEEEDEEIKDQDDKFEKMKNQQQRYFQEENIAIKCRNCQEYGHIAKHCHNERKKKMCILCGKDTHNSFECNEKSCFKCNQVGHLAFQCTGKNLMKCNRCLLNGHKEIRCLKIFRGDYNSSQLKLMRCIECGKAGHLKCTTEAMSKKIPIDTTVRDDLEEFHKNLKKSSKSRNREEERELRYSFDYVEEINPNSKYLKSNTNIMVPDKGSKKSYYDIKRESYQKYGIPKHHRPNDLYCCYCGDRHSDEDCEYKKYGNSKFQQFDKVRQRLNYQNQEYNDYDYRDYRDNRNYYDRGNSYSQRIANDPRQRNMFSNRKIVEYQDSSESESVEDRDISDSDSSGSDSSRNYSRSSSEDSSESDSQFLIDFNESKAKQIKKAQQGFSDNNSRQSHHHHHHHHQSSHRTVTNKHSDKIERSRSRDNSKKKKNDKNDKKKKQQKSKNTKKKSSKSNAGKYRY